MYTSYSDIPTKLLNRESFTGNSMWARRSFDGYRIYSYSTVIYDSSRNFFNTNYYSPTTSRHQNLVRKHLIVPKLQTTRRLY